MLPESIIKLSKILTRIPSIGPKSAEKLAIWFSGYGIDYAKDLGNILIELYNIVGICSECGYFSNGQGKICQYCLDTTRDESNLCLLEQNIDIINIEESKAFKGQYFVLGGVISPLEGVTISDLPFEKLKKKIISKNIKEIIIALGATTEADVTTMYLKEFLQEISVKITVLGRGIAVGTQIHYTGKKSLVEAFRIRENIDQ